MNRTDALDTERQAAAWLVRLDAEASAAILAQCQRWQRQDIRHRSAFVRLEQGWLRTDTLEALRPLDGKVRLDSLDIFPQAASRARTALPETLVPVLTRRIRYARLAVELLAMALAAGSLACVLVLSCWRFMVSGATG